MKVLVAYYSRSGTNQTLAKEIQEILNADIEEIIDTKTYKGILGFFIGGMYAFLKKMTKIEPIQKDVSLYDLVIIVSPLWSGVLPPATRTYIFQNKDGFKKLAFVSVSGAGERNKKAISDFEYIACQKPTAILLFSEKEFKEKSYQEKLKIFIKTTHQ